MNGKKLRYVLDLQNFTSKTTQTEDQSKLAGYDANAKNGGNIVYTQNTKSAVLVQKANATNDGVEVYDFEPKVMEKNDSLMTTTPMLQLLNTMTPVDIGGEIKLILPVKSHLTKVQRIERQAKGGASTQGRKDKITLEFGEDYTQEETFDRVIDLKQPELQGMIADELASWLDDDRETAELEVIGRFNDMLETGANKKEYSILASDGKTKITSTIRDRVVVIDATAVAGDEGKKAKLLADALWKVLEEQTKIGKKGFGKWEGHPQVRGIPKSTFACHGTPEAVKLLGMLPEFVPTGSAERMTRTGVLGAIHGVNIVENMGLELIKAPTDVSSTSDGTTANAKPISLLISPSGTFAPVFMGRKFTAQSRLVDGKFIGFTTLQFVTNWEMVVIPNYAMLVKAIVIK